MPRAGDLAAALAAELAGREPVEPPAPAAGRRCCSCCTTGAARPISCSPSGARACRRTRARSRCQVGSWSRATGRRATPRCARPRRRWASRPRRSAWSVSSTTSARWSRASSSGRSWPWPTARSRRSRATPRSPDPRGAGRRPAPGRRRAAGRAGAARVALPAGGRGRLGRDRPHPADLQPGGSLRPGASPLSDSLAAGRVAPRRRSRPRSPAGRGTRGGPPAPPGADGPAAGRPRAGRVASRLEREVRGRRSDELGQLVLGRQVVDALVQRHGPGGYQPPPRWG